MLSTLEAELLTERSHNNKGLQTERVDEIDSR